MSMSSEIEKDIQSKVDTAKLPGSSICPECNDKLFSPMDKLSIYLYGKCPIHINEIQEGNLLKISELL